MCGITGYISLSSKTSGKEQFIKANSIIRHRGPDGEGFLFSDIKGGKSRLCHSSSEAEEHLASSGEPDILLGHRRLAILDLSDAGAQPMSSEDDKLWIVFNGEIYNFLEIRKELEQLGYAFKSHCDTEVILQAYREWGTDCVSRFNGMWAFAIVDFNKGILFCSRDRFAIKPFFYFFDGVRFVFASEIKQLLCFPFIKPVVNDLAVYEFLEFGVVDCGEHTFYKDIFRLYQGCSLILDFTSKKMEKQKYYNPKLEINRDISFPEASKEFGRLFEDSIRFRLRSDVEVGTCLSGGLDSSSIVCVVNRILKDEGKADIQRTFSNHFDDEDADELEYMREVINFTKVRSHLSKPSAQDFIDDFKKLVWHQDEPFGSTSIFAQWSVFKSVNQNQVKVMLDGQGADEQLGGYLGLISTYLSQLQKNGDYGLLLREAFLFARKQKNRSYYRYIPFLSRFAGTADSYPVRNWMNESFRESVAENLVYPLHLAEKPFGEREDLANLLYQLTMHANIPSLLHYEDRNSMAFSVEGRVPFLDYRLVEFIFSLPSAYKIRWGYTKSVLRESMKGILPEKVRIRQSKLGFATPERSWQKTALGPVVEKALKDERLFRYIRKDEAMAYQNEVKKRSLHDSSFWRWINLSLWMDAFDVIFEA